MKKAEALYELGARSIGAECDPRLLYHRDHRITPTQFKQSLDRWLETEKRHLLQLADAVEGKDVEIYFVHHDGTLSLIGNKEIILPLKDLCNLRISDEWDEDEENDELLPGAENV